MWGCVKVAPRVILCLLIGVLWFYLPYKDTRSWKTLSSHCYEWQNIFLCVSHCIHLPSFLSPHLVMGADCLRFSLSSTKLSCSHKAQTHKHACVQPLIPSRKTNTWPYYLFFRYTLQELINPYSGNKRLAVLFYATDFLTLGNLGEHSTLPSSNQSPAKLCLEQTYSEGLSKMNLHVDFKRVCLFVLPEAHRALQPPPEQEKFLRGSLEWCFCSLSGHKLLTWSVYKIPYSFSEWPGFREQSQVEHESCSGPPDSRRHLSTSHIIGMRATNVLVGVEGDCSLDCLIK